jgi:hypothetical protein
VKRFNYTGRKKIYRHDVKVRLQTDTHETPRVDLTADLKNYDFPVTASVFLESQQWKTRFMRIPLGRLSENIRKNGIELDEFDDGDGLTFKVKVVDEDEGLLLGIAEGIKPYNKDDQLDDNQKSILPVSSTDLSQYGVLWRIQYEDEEAVLQVETELGSRDQVVRSLTFRGFILPAAMQQILSRIVADEWDTELLDPQELSTRWLLFAQQLGAGLPDKEADDHEEWITEAVRILSNKIGVRDTIIEDFDSGAWK